jgi:hypothetical protein
LAASSFILFALSNHCLNFFLKISLILLFIFLTNLLNKLYFKSNKFFLYFSMFLSLSKKSNNLATGTESVIFLVKTISVKVFTSLISCLFSISFKASFNLLSLSFNFFGVI